jgi:hypothetical protein
MLAMALLTVGGYFLVGRTLGLDRGAATGGPSQLGVVLRLLLPAIAATFLAIAVHEVGHALAGWSVGMRLMRLAIGPVALERTSDGRLALRRARDIAMLGHCAMRPHSLVALRARFAWMVLGGPLANVIVFAALAPWCMDAIDHLIGTDGQVSMVKACLALTAALNAVFAFSNCVPYRERGFATDGLHFLTTLWGGRTWRRREEALHLDEWHRGTVPPDEWDRAILDRATARGDGDAHEATMQLFAWWRDYGSAAGNAHRNRAFALRDQMGPAFARYIATDFLVERAIMPESSRAGAEPPLSVIDSVIGPVVGSDPAVAAEQAATIERDPLLERVQQFARQRLRGEPSDRAALAECAASSLPGSLHQHWCQQLAEAASPVASPVASVELPAAKERVGPMEGTERSRSD